MRTPEPSTVICEDRNFEEWHRGHPWCAVWVLRTEQAEVVELVARARAKLAPWLLPRYARQPHVTLAYRGLMAAGEAAESVNAEALEHLPAYAEFGVAQLRADVRALQAAQLSAWTLQLQGSGSFSTVPYWSVLPDADLLRAHDVLAAQAQVSAEQYPGWRYVPHVTLGHFACQVPLAEVEATLRSVIDSEVAYQLQVHELWLARYRTEDIAGSLSFEGCFDLRTQRYRSQPGALLPLEAWPSRDETKTPNGAEQLGDGIKQPLKS